MTDDRDLLIRIFTEIAQHLASQGAFSLGSAVKVERKARKKMSMAARKKMAAAAKKRWKATKKAEGK